MKTVHKPTNIASDETDFPSYGTYCLVQYPQHSTGEAMLPDTPITKNPEHGISSIENK